MIDSHLQQLNDTGYTIIDGIFTEGQVTEILNLINQADTSKETFRKSADLFAIRQFLKEIPEVNERIFTDKLKRLLSNLFRVEYFVIKSIYFDKPEQSNWFVSYHQDLTVSVDKKTELDGYGMWTVKQGQFAVQPPLTILKEICTIRIHLDDTDEENGALKVVPGSHLKGIYRAGDIDWTKETEEVCKVAKGGVMVMKPLLLHSSSRTTNHKKRRVIHIEFCNQELHEELQWVERINFV